MVVLRRAVHAVPASCAQQEKQKAMVNELVGKLADVCWDKCCTAAPGSKLSSSESTCLTNCAQRFLDTSALIVRKMQSR